MEVTTAITQVLALENGAPLAISPGVACDPTNPMLVHMADMLSERLEAVGIDLLALWLEGDCLVAQVDEEAAEEPLCPFLFNQVVRKLSYQLTGWALDGRIEDLVPVPALVQLV